LTAGIQAVTKPARRRSQASGFRFLEEEVANTKSAEKRYRQSLKRRALNTHWRSTAKTAVRKVREAIESKDPAKATEAFRAAEKSLKKAVSKGIVHKRNASRHVARLAKAVAAAAK
jgi:small subunit ribosomal protein S20